MEMKNLFSNVHIMDWTSTTVGIVKMQAWHVSEELAYRTSRPTCPGELD